MLRIVPVLIASTVMLGAAAQAAQDGHYATKADEKARKVTPGRPAAAPRAEAPNAGGENCASATVISALPFNDSDDTTGNVDDNSTLPGGCSDYTTTGGPDLIYSFTTGAGNSVAFTVTPTDNVYDVSIYVLGTCGASATCVIGADACLAEGQPHPGGCIDQDGDEDIPATAFATGTHAFYVDSFYAAGAPCGGQGNILCGTGPYTLSVTGVLPVELIDIQIQ
jgi:hypothetical protein